MAGIWTKMQRWCWLRKLARARSHHRGFELGRGIVMHVPVRADGKGTLCIGDDCRMGYIKSPRVGDGEILLQARDKESLLRIGAGTKFSNNASVVATLRIEIGTDCLIGDLALICDSDFHDIPPATRNTGEGQSLPVTLGNRVWLGTRAMVLKGVTIGDNTIVGAGSVVTRSLPANCIAGGVPAKVLRQLT